MNKFLKHILTGIDGITFAPARVLWVLGAIVFLALAVYVVLHTGSFNFTEFGIALGTILGGGGAGVKLTETSEPDPEPPKDDA